MIGRAVATIVIISATAAAGSLPGAVESEVSLRVTMHDRRDGLEFIGKLVLTDLTRGGDPVALDVGGTNPTTVELAVQPGPYSLAFLSEQAAGQELVLVSEPQIVVDHDVDLVLSGAGAKEVTVDVGEETRRLGVAISSNRSAGALGEWAYSVRTEVEDARVYATPTERVTLGEFQVTTAWELVGTDSYHLLVPERGQVPDDLEYSFREADLAAIDISLAADVTGRTYGIELLGLLPGAAIFGATQVDVPAPGRHVAWVTPEAGWLQTVTAGDSRTEAMLGSELRHYARGTATAQRWFSGPVRPGLPIEWSAAHRSDDFVSFNLPFLDREGHFGYSVPGFDAAHIELQSHDTGEVILADDAMFLDGTVPPESIMYDLVLETTRTAPWWLTSTSTSSTWTFESSRVADAAIPLLSFDYEWQSDSLNRVALPAEVRIDVALRKGTESLVPDVSTIRGWFSLDHGTSWTEMPLTRAAAASYSGTIPRARGCDVPCRPSVRFEAVDASGTTLTQTVLDAMTAGPAAPPTSGPSSPPATTWSPPPTLPPTGSQGLLALWLAGLALLCASVCLVLARQRP